VAVAAKKKDPAAVALRRKGGKKGGLARAAKRTPAQRSESNEATTSAVVRSDTSDRAFLSLLKRYKATNDPTEMEALSEQIERTIFHKQYENAKA
jgi:hypothetical protein